MKHKLLSRHMILPLLALGLFFSGIWGCDVIKQGAEKFMPKKTAPVKRVVKGTVVARVNDIPVTLDELNQAIESFNALVSQDAPDKKITTREEKVNYLKNEMVRRALLYREALDRGLDTNEEVVKALEISKMDILIMELMRQEMQKVEVTSKEIEDFYETYKDRLKEPEERQIREIVVPTEQEAKDILIQLLQGADFANLAKTRSKSSTAGNGGDLGFIGRDTKFPQFDAIAFSDTLDVGKVSSIFKGPEGYYIIKVEGKRGGEQRNLSEIYDKIKVNLTDYKRKQALENLINKISKDANIEVYEGEIK